MAILTEIPADNAGDTPSQDRQIQPMEHEVQNGADNGRDIGRVSLNISRHFLRKLGVSNNREIDFPISR